MMKQVIRDSEYQSRRVSDLSIAPHPALRQYYPELGARQDFLNELFNRTAYQYRNVDRATGFGYGIWYRRRALLAAGLKPSMHMVAVACGPALMAQCAHDIVGSSGSVIGLDPRIGLLRVAQRGAS